MPLYEYQCTQCGQRTELLQRFADAPLAECPSCGAPVKKLISSPAFQFKGSGWYVTDYAKKGAGADKGEKSEKGDKSEAAGSSSGGSGGAGAGDGAKPAAAGSDSGGGSKSETKSSAKSESKPAAGGAG